MNVCAPESHSALIESQFYYHCRVLFLFIGCASDTCIFGVLFQLEIHRTETVIGIGVPENKRVPSPEISRSWNVSGTPRLYCVVLFGPRVHLAVLSMSEGGLGFVKQGVSFSEKKTKQFAPFIT